MSPCIDLRHSRMRDCHTLLPRRNGAVCSDQQCFQICDAPPAVPSHHPPEKVRPAAVNSVKPVVTARNNSLAIVLQRDFDQRGIAQHRGERTSMAVVCTDEESDQLALLTGLYGGLLEHPHG